MHILVNGVQLYFDVEGASLVPDGPTMREKPTMILLHGGPGADHTILALRQRWCSLSSRPFALS